MHAIQAYSARWALFGTEIVEQGVLFAGFAPAGPPRILATVDPRLARRPSLEDLIRSWRCWDSSVPEADSLVQQLPDVDCGSGVLLPTLVNCHTHLEFSDLAAPLLPAGCAFADWIRAVISRRATNTGLTSEASVDPAQQKSAICQRGWAEMIHSGTGAVGEILSYPTPHPDYADPLWQTGPRAFQGVVFHEVLGLAPTRAQASWEWAMTSSSKASIEPAGLIRGISPHAPYSTSTWLYRQSAAWCLRHSLPLATHLAESPEELELLTQRRGPLVDLLKDLGVWRPEEIAARSVRDVLRELVQVPRLLVVHGNYLTGDDWRWLRHTQPHATVVYCPQTHAYFQHAPHPWRQMLRDGLNVALGTDSRGSSLSLSLWDDLLLLRAQAPEQDPRLLWQMATQNGARALGCEDRLGSLEPGKLASCCLAHLTNPIDDFSWEALLERGTRLSRVH